MREANRSRARFQVKEDDVDSPGTWLTGEIVLTKRRLNYRSFAKTPVFEVVTKKSTLTSRLEFLRLLAVEIPQDHGLPCQVIYSQFSLVIRQNDHQARRRFVEWAQNEIAVVPDFHKRILLSNEAHFWLNGYVNKQNCRIWSEANPQVYVETPLHPEKLTIWCALWAGGILLQKR
ncbi:transposable element Tc3 transposase [Trichonephila clavipes]|nr:transposable element Tc3 transposase [Trichonephila clavipes]